MNALRILLAGLVDYAGLFPPAGLAMPAAVANYAAYRAGEHAALLGRFVVPATRLDEFAAAARDDWSPRAAGEPWRLSALVGADAATDGATITAFNQRYGNRALIDTVELRAATPEAVAEALAALPGGLTPYVELPLDERLDALIAAVARAGGRAKVRTGGVTADLFPTPAELLRFIAACVAAELPFKATAGLHHPLRSVQRLTYERDAPSGLMYGFLNVFLTAALLKAGVPVTQAAPALEESDPGAFRFDETGVTWRGLRVSLDILAQVREHVAIAFGSCSFQEPVDDLKAMNLL